MVLTIPLLGIVKIICDHIPSLKPYGYLIGSDRKKKNRNNEVRKPPFRPIS